MSNEPQQPSRRKVAFGLLSTSWAILMSRMTVPCASVHDRRAFRHISPCRTDKLTHRATLARVRRARMPLQDLKSLLRGSPIELTKAH